MYDTLRHWCTMTGRLEFPFEKKNFPSYSTHAKNLRWVPFFVGWHRLKKIQVSQNP